MGAESAESGEPENELRTHHHLIARSHVHYDDARRKDFYIARARARAIASASHELAMPWRLASRARGRAIARRANANGAMLAMLAWGSDR